MNIKDRILDMDRYLVENDFVTGDRVESEKDLLICIHTDVDIFEPCMYIGESDNWVNIIDLSLGEGGQYMDIRKNNIIGFGLYNGPDIFTVPPDNSKTFYN